MLYQNAYVIDQRKKASYNVDNKNFADAYFPEIFDSLGIRAEKLLPDFSAAELKNIKCLYAGNCNLSSQERTLTEFVKNGGCLILFATEGLAALCGNYEKELLPQDIDIFAVRGYLNGSDFFSRADKEIKLPVVSNIKVITPACDAEILAEIEADGRIVPGITRRSVGKGFVYYFAFSLPQTVWYIRQGKPVTGDFDGDAMWRTLDGIVACRDAVPFTDIYQSMLTDIMEKTYHQPYLFELPVIEENIPDYIMFIPGDDEGASDVQIPAAEEMHKRGLPYHINIMPNEAKDGFNIPRDMITKLRELGTEPSLHYDFLTKNEKPFQQEDIYHQALLYRGYFGEAPCVICNHCLMFAGWAEHARWSSECGIMGGTDKPNGPINPINSYGCAFGTLLPYFVYDDAAHDNQKINYVEIPWALYEPRIYPETEEENKALIRLAIYTAKKSGTPLSVFIHPIYLSQWDTEATLKALDYIVEYTKSDNKEVITVDDFCRWWFDRSAIALLPLSETKYAANSVRPFAVKLDTSVGLQVDGDEIKPETREISGKKWNLFKIPAGNHIIERMEKK